jgi:hypothetical protein
MPLVEVGWHYGKNELRISSIMLNSMYPEHVCFFLHGGLLGTIYHGNKGSMYIQKPLSHTHTHTLPERFKENTQGWS